MSNQELEDSMTALTDTILFQRVQEGDMASFDHLFFRHYDRVYGLLFRLVGSRAEAEDLTQEVFVKLYRQPLAATKDINVGGWLYKVATNLGYNHIRSRKRRWRRNRWLLPDESQADTDPSRLADISETRKAVRAALSRLPERDTRLLLLREMGLSYAELSEVCDIAPGSVGTMLRRAAETFRRVYLEENDNLT